MQGLTEDKFWESVQIKLVKQFFNLVKQCTHLFTYQIGIGYTFDQAEFLIDSFKEKICNILLHPSQRGYSLKRHVENAFIEDMLTSTP